MAPAEWNTYNPAPEPEKEPPRTSEQGEVRRGTSLRPLIGAAVAIGVIAFVGFSVLRGAFGNEDPQSADGFAQLLADLEDKTGSTEIFEVIIYPGYARIEVPIAANDEREVSYRWDGKFSMEMKSTNKATPFDLSDVDPALFSTMCDEVGGLVDDPELCYLIIKRPDHSVPGRADGWIRAYASNDFSQSAWISYDLAGDEVARIGD